MKERNEPNKSRVVSPAWSNMSLNVNVTLFPPSSPSPCAPPSSPSSVHSPSESGVHTVRSLWNVSSIPGSGARLGRSMILNEGLGALAGVVMGFLKGEAYL